MVVYRFDSDSSSLLKLHTMNIENWRFGLVTREIVRISEDLFEIHDTSDGWQIAEVDKQTLKGVIDGTISLTTLNWN